MEFHIKTGEVIPGLERMVKLFFFMYFTCNVIGITLDSIDYYENNLSLLLGFNIFNLSVAAILLPLLFLRKITIRLANPIFFYILTLNLLFTDIYNINHNVSNWQITIFRNAFIYMISIIDAGIINRKRHVLVLTILYLAFISFAVYKSEPGYFADNAFITAMCVCLFSVATVSYIYKLEKSISSNAELQKTVFDRDIELLRRKHELELQKSKFLEESIAQKNKELTTDAMMLAQNIEFRKRIHDQVCTIHKSDKTMIDNDLHNLVSVLTMFNQNNQWNEFQKRFEGVHLDFYTKLNSHYPRLTPSELKLAALIKLGLSSKEIASITQNTTESVHVARSRLRKKLNLNMADNLTSFFINYN